MSKVKETYLNGLPSDLADQITGYGDSVQFMSEQDKKEMELLTNLAYQLHSAVQSGEMDSDYAEYLFLHPIEGVEWVEAYLGIKLV